ncbi:MAG: hypothetical protein ABI318_21060 [Chthoniobacteraceae bacterium]
MKTIVTAFLAAATLAFAEAPPAGTARGTCANKGEAPVALAFATAFVDQKDERKPTLLILSDVKLPAEKWTSEFDLMRAGKKFSGAIFFLNKDNEVFRSDFYWKGRQSSVSGYFKLKLDAAAGKDLIGTVASSDNDAKAPKVDATFHVTLK